MMSQGNMFIWKVDRSLADSWLRRVKSLGILSCMTTSRVFLAYSPLQYER